MMKVKNMLVFLDIRDLVSLVVFAYDDQKVEDNSHLASLIHHGLGKFMINSDGVTVAYLARRHKFKPVLPTDTLDVVMKVLAGGVHRVPVLGDNGRVVNIISQSTFVKLFGTVTEEDHLPLSSIPQLGTQPVITVNSRDSLITTLRILEANNLSGVAIINEEGKMLGTTTGKDLKIFFRNPTLQALNRPILDNMKMMRADDIFERNLSFGVFESDNLKRLIGLLCATKVHRVFVMNNESEYYPIRVISVTDLLKYLSSE